MAVVREKAFYSDDLVKCIRFSRIEDRTALHSPDKGYFVFVTGKGEVQLPPQAVEARFFFDELEFPEFMKPADDLERLAALKNSLARAAGINPSVAASLVPYLERISDAVQRLTNEEWWESPRGWISREDRDKRTAKAETSAIDAAAESVERSLRDANGINEVGGALESVAELEKLPATSLEVLGYRQSLAARLRTEVEQRRVQLENSLIAGLKSKLLDALGSARSLADVLALETSVSNLANATVSSPQALATRKESLSALLSLIETKERDMRIKETVFDDLNSWRKALDECGGGGVRSDPEAVSLVARSEALYQKAYEVSEKLLVASENLRRFLSGLPTQIVSSGEGFPPAPTDGEEVLKIYDTLLAQSGDSRAVSVGDLDARADFLRENLLAYRRLAAISKRANRLELWRDAASHDEVLNQMHDVRTAILDEKTTWEAFVARARNQESGKDFAAAASSYQSAHDIAPSVDLASKVKAMKNQDLGL